MKEVVQHTADSLCQSKKKEKDMSLKRVAIHPWDRLMLRHSTLYSFKGPEEHGGFYH